MNLVSFSTLPSFFVNAASAWVASKKGDWFYWAEENKFQRDLNYEIFKDDIGLGDNSALTKIVGGVADFVIVANKTPTWVWLLVSGIVINTLTRRIFKKWRF